MKRPRGKNVRELVAFARRRPGWHTAARDRATRDALASAVRQGFITVNSHGQFTAREDQSEFRLEEPGGFWFKVRIEMEVGAPTASEAAGRAFDHVKQAQALTFDVESVSPDLAVRDKITVVNKENHNA